jgi:hypothetical protein
VSKKGDTGFAKLCREVVILRLMEVGELLQEIQYGTLILPEMLVYKIKHDSMV